MDEMECEVIHETHFKGYMQSIRGCSNYYKRAAANLVRRMPAFLLTAKNVRDQSWRMFDSVVPVVS